MVRNRLIMAGFGVIGLLLIIGILVSFGTFDKTTGFFIFERENGNGNSSEFYNLEQSIVQQGVSSLVERDSYIIEFINEPVFKKDKAIEDRIKNLKNELQKAENIGAQVKAESLGNEARILE